MSQAVKIIVGALSLEAEFFDTPCAKAVLAALPLEARPSEWGDEFYFEIPVEMPLDETATVRVKAGDIGYWPPGNCLAIFFGPTPMSAGPDPVPASEVNIVGRIKGDSTLLRGCRGVKAIWLGAGDGETDEAGKGGDGEGEN
jgi:hypothetical protein